MSRVNQSRNQSKAAVKDKQELRKKIQPKEIHPYRTRLKLSPEVTDRLVKYVIKKKEEIIEEMQSVTAGLETDDSINTRLKNGRKTYENKVDATDWPYPDASNIPGGIIPSSVDGMRANIMKAVKIDPPVTGINEPDEEKAKQKEKFIYNELRFNMPNSYQELSSWVHYSLLHGVGFIKHYDKIVFKDREIRTTYKNLEDYKRKYKVGDYPDLVKRLKQGESVRVVEKVKNLIPDYEHVIEWVDPTNMVVSPKAKDIEKCFIGEYAEYNAEEIVEEDFENIDDLFEKTSEFKDLELSDEEFKTIQCELSFDYNGDGKRERLFVVVEYDKEILLLAEKQPYGRSLYIPMFIQNYQGNFWRLGLYDKLFAIHQTDKEIIDIILNSAYITYIPSFKALNTGSFDPTTQDWYPGVVWYLDNLDDVVQWDIRPSQQPFSEWHDRMKQEAYERAGISPYTQGSPMSAGESGRKVLALLSAGGVRIEEVVANINTALNKLYFQILELANQRITKPIVLEDRRGATEINPEIFENGNERYISTLDANNFNPDAVIERNLLVINTLLNSPFAQNIEGLIPAFEKFLRSAGVGWDNLVDEILPSQEDMNKKRTDEAQMALRDMMSNGELGAVLDRDSQRPQ